MNYWVCRPCSALWNRLAEYLCSHQEHPAPLKQSAPAVRRIDLFFKFLPPSVRDGSLRSDLGATSDFECVEQHFSIYSKCEGTLLHRTGRFNEKWLEMQIKMLFLHIVSMLSLLLEMFQVRYSDFKFILLNFAIWKSKCTWQKHTSILSCFKYK